MARPGLRSAAGSLGRLCGGGSGARPPRALSSRGRELPTRSTGPSVLSVGRRGTEGVRGGGGAAQAQGAASLEGGGARGGEVPSATRGPTHFLLSLEAGTRADAPPRTQTA